MKRARRPPDPGTPHHGPTAVLLLLTMTSSSGACSRTTRPHLHHLHRLGQLAPHASTPRAAVQLLCRARPPKRPTAFRGTATSRAPAKSIRLLLTRTAVGTRLATHSTPHSHGCSGRMQEHSAARPTGLSCRADEPSRPLIHRDMCRRDETSPSRFIWLFRQSPSLRFTSRMPDRQCPGPLVPFPNRCLPHVSSGPISVRGRHVPAARESTGCEH